MLKSLITMVVVDAVSFGTLSAMQLILVLEKHRIQDSGMAKQQTTMALSAIQSTTGLNTNRHHLRFRIDMMNVLIA